MPRPFDNAVITDAGLSLLNKAQAGIAAMRFTRMATGDGTYAADEKTPSALRERTGLKSEKNSYALSSVEIVGNNKVKLTALLTNQDPVTGEALVTEGYCINEVGLYAEEKDGDGDTEVLYSVAVTAAENGDYMPPFASGSVPAQIVQEYHATVSDSANVTIECVGAAMLAEDAEKLLERLTLSYDEESGELQLKDGDRALSSEEINPADESFNINEQTLEFEEASERENIASGERLDTMLGKIQKIFNDLKEAAFTGSYNDLSNKPKGSVTLSATIAAADWTGDAAPFENSLSVEGVTESSVVDISLDSSATQAQAIAWMAGQFADGGQEENGVTIKAFGTKPEVDIPVTVVIRGGA